MTNVALGQEEVYFCAFSLLTLTSLRNPWDSHAAMLMNLYICVGFCYNN